MEQQKLGLANTELPSERNESNKLVTSSKKASAVMAARMLDFVREMSLGTEDFTQRQSDYWIFALQSYPPRLIESAFNQWVQKSKHMPVPSEIIALLNGMIEKERQASIAKKTDLYLRELRETRQKLAAEGLAYGEVQVHSILRKAAEIVKSFPELPNPNRAYALKERLAQERRMSRKSVQRAEGVQEKKDVSA